MAGEESEATARISFEFTRPNPNEEDVKRLARKAEQLSSMLHEMRDALQEDEGIHGRAEWRVTVDGKTKDSGEYKTD